MSRKNIFKSFLSAVALLTVAGLAGFVKADDDVIKKIITQLEAWTTTHPIEKVYLQTDKPYYALGDDIWFKGYVTIGGDHRLSAYSSVLNVELLDENEKVQRWIKLPIQNGSATGDFALPDTLKAGSYRIRAYTNWMRNAGSDYFFDKTILIGSTASNAVLATTTYSYASVNGQQKVTAAIIYTSLSGSPLSSKDVSYEVELDNKTITKGKGTTDAQGKLVISFNSVKPPQLIAGKISTHIKTGDKTTVEKNVAFSNLSGNTDVQFFPESGSLVNGIRSKVAFKAVGVQGLGVAVKGVIKDNAGTDVAVIKTQHAGMGVFPLLPEAGKSYNAHLTYPDGSQKVVALPKAADQGYVLSITNEDVNQVYVRISASSALVGHADEELNLVAQSGGVVCYAAKTKLTSASRVSAIPKSRFPTGIAQFTLFSSSGQPICERVVFVNRNDLLNIKVNTGKSSFAVREKVKVNLNVSDSSGKAAVGNFSAAVIDETKVPVDENTESTILSNILLTSDLKGYIEQPNYYFNNSNATAQSDLDVLMLTQGYRRFEWRQILAGTAPVLTYQPEKSLQVSGIIKTLSNKPVANGKVTLISTTGGSFILDTVTDSQGRFVFNNLLFKDSVRFIVQGRTAKNGKNVTVEIDKSGSHLTSVNRNSADVEIIATNATTYLQSTKTLHEIERRLGIGNHPILLKEVNITAKKEQSASSYNNLNGSGNADQIIKGDFLRNMGCYSLAQCLQGRLTGVIFRGNVPYLMRSQNIPMQIVIDGIQTDISFLDNLNPNDVASIEVLRSIGYTAIYGSRGGGGVLLINTRRGNDPDYVSDTPPVGFSTYLPKGYYVARQFYSPQYDDPKVNTQLADLRSTTAWQPDIITDKDGQASFEFYNAGSAGSYRVVVEGIDVNGNLGRRVYRYKVE